MLLTKLADVGMMAAGVYPSDGNILVSTGPAVIAALNRAISSVVGAFVASLVAREFATRTVMILGGVVTFLNVSSVFVNWNSWTAANVWYPISLSLLPIPLCLIGGKIYGRTISVKT